MKWADPDQIKRQLQDSFVVPETAPRKPIQATPFVYREPSTIPPREVVYGRHFVRKFISGTAAPGGLGKSTQARVEAVAMATGRDLLGVPVRQRLKVWYWCGEDPMDELERSFAGILKYYGIPASEIEGWLCVDSGRDCEIVIASETKDGAVIAEPVIQDLEDTIRENGIDVWVFDPFVSCHEVSENDNNKIGRVMRELAMLADRTNTAGELVHHVRKNSVSSEVTVEDSRGAKAFIDRVRSARTLNRMSQEEAQHFNLDAEEAAHMFRVDIGKSNLFAPARSAVWRRIVSVDLENAADGRPSDHVGVVTLWKPPSLWKDISVDDSINVQKKIHSGSWRVDVRAKDWAGKAVADVLGWDDGDDAVKAQVKAMLKAWVTSDVLRIARRDDGQRRKVEFYEVGKWIER